MQKRNDFRGEVWINVHPDVMEAMRRANETPVDGGYGDESVARAATALMQREFRDPIYTTFTVNGTAANVMALKAMLDRWSTVLCAKQTHIDNYEAGATEFNLGNKILTIESPDGKITPALLDLLLLRTQNYKYLPKVVSLAQPTEFGTVYTPAELKAVCDWAHARDMYVYVDGARLANGLVALGLGIGELLEGADVDAFSFGGTKAGAMFGEMVVFRRKEFARYLKYSQKQSLQHMAKSKFLSAQLEVILRTGLWKTNAELANDASQKLAAKLAAKGISFAYPVESNTVFAILEPAVFGRVTEVFDLHYWNEEKHVVRLATTYLTTDEAIDTLVGLIP